MCLCFSKSGLFSFGTSEIASPGFTSASFALYCPGPGFYGLTAKNSFLAIVLVEEYFGAEFKTFFLYLEYSAGPGVFSFSSRGFLGDFENKLTEDDLYLVPLNAGSWVPGPGNSTLKSCISSIKVFLLVWVVVQRGAVFLFFRWDSYCPGAGILDNSWAMRSLTLFLQENPLLLATFSSTKVDLL